MAQLTDKLPAAENDFAGLIDNHLIYADKTDLVADLARNKDFLFLARPRRFGKTLVLSTLEELFKNGKGRFKDLRLEKDEPWTDTGTYNVIKLSFNSSAKPGPGTSFYQTFGNKLRPAVLNSGLTWTDDPCWTNSFKLVLQNAGSNSVVLLIDDYDAPLLQVLEDPCEYEERRSVLSSFFETVKSNTKVFRFIFITGCTGYHGHGVMANSVSDLSFDLDLGAVAGLTQAELELNFKTHIARAAKVLDEKDPQGRWDEQKVLEALKQCCGGCSFDMSAGHEAYNPRAVIDFLARPEEGFKHNRLESGGNAGPVRRLSAD